MRGAKMDKFLHYFWMKESTYLHISLTDSSEIPYQRGSRIIVAEKLTATFKLPSDRHRFVPAGDK